MKTRETDIFLYDAKGRTKKRRWTKRE